MSYIYKYILPGESVLIQGRMTKKRYLTAVLLLVLGSILGILTQGGILAFIISGSSFFVALITGNIYKISHIRLFEIYLFGYL